MSTNTAFVGSNQTKLFPDQIFQLIEVLVNQNVLQRAGILMSETDDIKRLKHI